MAKRSRTPPTATGNAGKAANRPQRPGVVHTSLYLPRAVHEALREAAFKGRCKIHDIVLEGIELALRKHERKGKGR